MTEQSDNSSLPVLLAISATVVLSAGIGWLFLGMETATEIDPEDIQPDLSQGAIIVEPGNVTPEVDIDATFRKARLAADANMLAEPRDRSAINFYGQILVVEPDNAIADAELDAVISRIATRASAHLTAGEFDDAYDLAAAVATVRPNHRLVQDVEGHLDDLASGYVADAMQHAQDGNEAEATAALSEAQALPARKAEYFAAVRGSIAEISATRRAAEDRVAADARQAVEQATASWVQKVRGAIDTRQLIAPAGASARDYLAEANAPPAQKQQLTGELVTELIAESIINMERDQLPLAESFLNAASELAGDNEQLDALRASLEQSYIEAESNRLISTRQLVRVTTVAPRFPSVASKRGVSGWVELAFTVTSSGETANIEVTRSEPEKLFDRAAIDAVGQWTFEPRVFRGQVIDQRVGVRLVFELE